MELVDEQYIIIKIKNSSKGKFKTILSIYGQTHGQIWEQGFKYWYYFVCFLFMGHSSPTQTGVYTLCHGFFSY